MGNVSSDTVVDARKIMKRRGSITVTGRYVNNRPLESEYTFEDKVLGSGMSGPVRLAKKKDSGTKVAVKSFKKKGLGAEKRTEMQSETEIYLALDHPHVARLEHVFETSEDLHLVMEYMEGGELYDRLSSMKQYSEEMAAETTYQMLQALAYCHAHQVVHRDLKLENFMYERKDTNHLKLIDFGFAKFWKNQEKMSQACGSLHYVAPEVLMHSYTEKADMWSLGVIVYMLLLGSPPFHGKDNRVMQRIKEGRPMWSSRFPSLSEGAQEFVKLHMQVDADARPTAQESLEHPWIKGRHLSDCTLDSEVLGSLRRYAKASHFQRACLSMMAWSLSREERLELRELFEGLDVHHTGTINIQTLKEVLREKFRIDSTEAEALFQTLDADHDHEIAYTEFLAATLQSRVRFHESLLRETFHRFDTDETGSISVKNLHQILGETFEGVEVEELMKEADANHDGSISYEEFLDYLQQTDREEVEDQPVISRKKRHLQTADKLIDKLLEKSESGQEFSRTMSPKKE